MLTRSGLDFANLEKVEGLEMLQISNLADGGVLNLPSLKRLSAGMDTGLTLGRLPRLEEAHLYRPNIDHLEKLPLSAPMLQKLSIFDCKIGSVPDFSSLKCLSTLVFGHLKNLKSIAFVAKIPNLVDLQIETARKIEDIEDTLSRCTLLKKVTLFAVPPLTSWAWLDNLDLDHLVCLQMRLPKELHPKIKNIAHVCFKY